MWQCAENGRKMGCFFLITGLFNPNFEKMDYRFLTYGRLSDDFENFIKVNYPGISIVCATSKDEVRRLIPSVNSIAGFNFLRGQDLSSIYWIHSFGAGVDAFLKLDLQQSTILTRTTGDLGRKIGEFCLAHMFSDLKALTPLYENQKKSLWKQVSTSNLFDTSILILGTGTVGQAVADQLKGRAKKVAGINKSRSQNPAFDEIHGWDSFDATEIDVVINTLPYTPETAGILREELLREFNQILFINVGRGDSVEEKVLLSAIENGWIRKAVLDVFPEEPLEKNSPWWTNEKVIISPHQSGITTIEDVNTSFTLAYDALQRGEKNQLFVDIEKGY